LFGNFTSFLTYRPCIYSLPPGIEVVAFKIPNIDIDRSANRFLTHWNEETNVFTLQLFFKDCAQELKRAVEAEVASASHNASDVNADAMGV